ncbi:MAG TPA: hypothetical protein VK141_03130 [Nitrosomonas sp.]|nr:hypothetical protein [Nitrosomonas sp.]
MKLSVFFVAILCALTFVACKPKAPEGASSENYGTTHEGKPAEGRNELPK